MGIFGVFLFGEADSVIVKEIAKLHKVSEEKVDKLYKELLERLEDKE